MALLSAAELNLFDFEVPEGTALSVWPCTREYTEDPFWYDSGGRNPFHRKRVHKMSAGEDRKRKLGEVVSEFPRYGPKMYEWAVEQDDPSLLKELFELGVSLDIEEAKRRDGDDEETDDENDPYPTVEMQPALHVAAFEGKLECVKVIVEHGRVDVNSKDENDTTALTNALIKGHEEIVDWLLEQGSNLTFEADQVDDLQAALRSSKVALVEKVLEHPQSIKRRLHIKTSHLASAASSLGDPTDVVRFVLQCSCFRSTTTRSQRDAIVQSLEFAVSAGSIESIRLMLPFLTKQNEDGSFEYVDLSQEDQSRIFNATEDALKEQDIPELFELVWETFLCNSTGTTGPSDHPTVLTKEDRLNRRLISACTEGCVETCRLLIDRYGADIHHVSHKYSTTPLGRATGSIANPLSRRLPVARYLLEEKHVNIHLADGEFANSPTPLAQILKFSPTDQEEMIKLLLKNGGPLEETNEAVSRAVENAEAGTQVTLFLVLHEGPRYPVMLTTEQAQSDAEGGQVQVEIQASREEWTAWLASMQLRKSDEELAAEDPKGRPLG